MKTEALLESLSAAVERAAIAEVLDLVRRALDEGHEPFAVVEGGLAAGLRRSGEKWSQGEIFLPELVVAAEAMKAGMRLVEPHLGAGGKEEGLPRGAAVIGTVQGDIHDIGKSLVGTMLSASGFKVIDLGNNVSAAKFIETAVEHSARIIAMSALLTTTMVHQGALIRQLKEEGLRDRFIILCGGAPVTDEWVASIGADGTAPDAVGASRLACSLVET